MAYKDAETVNWCDTATKHTGKEWKYMKVPDRFFRGMKNKTQTFAEMIELLINYLDRKEKEKLF